MILATDTHYAEDFARTAGVMFQDWSDASPTDTWAVETEGAADYEPGSFYKRELPLILSLLAELKVGCPTVRLDIC